MADLAQKTERQNARKLKQIVRKDASFGSAEQENTKRIQVNSIIQKSLRRNGNTGQDFAPLARKIGGLDSVPAPTPARNEYSKLEFI